MATIIRYSSREALTIFPPPLTGDGQWHEVRDGVMVSRDAHIGEPAVIGAIWLAWLG